jgi:DNA-binding transcriptional regulator GbsR (MarR family)
MSKDYHNICKNILKSNEELHVKDSLQKSIDDVKRDLKNISHKIDRIYNLLVNFINNREF